MFYDLAPSWQVTSLKQRQIIKRPPVLKLVSKIDDVFVIVYLSNYKVDLTAKTYNTVG